MRIGIWMDVAGLTMPEVPPAAAKVAVAGYHTLWLGELGGWDPLTVLTAVGLEVPSVRLGTAVVRTHPRHPLALAAQALTTGAAVGDRLVLGIGASHAPIIEGQYGLPFTAPARNMREYLTALIPLLHGEPVDQHGADWTAVGRLDAPGATPPSVLVAALGPRMLRLAGELADGVLTTWAGPATIGEVFMPRLAAGAGAVGRPVPEVVAQVPICLTDDPDGVRERVGRELGMAAALPSYRALFDAEGLAGPGDAVVAGDGRTLSRALAAYADVGVAEFLVTPVGTEEERARTIAGVPELFGA